MYVKHLNSETFLVFNDALVSYRDLNLQNANKMTSIQDRFIIAELSRGRAPYSQNHVHHFSWSWLAERFAGAYEEVAQHSGF